MSLLTNLISHWKLDETSGNALDAHGSNTLAETSGTIDSATGKVGNCRDFEAGDTEHFEIADNADVSVGDFDFEFSCWVNPESLANGCGVLGKWNATGTGSEYALLYFSGRFVFAAQNPSNAQVNVFANTFGAPAIGTWYFLTCGYDATADQLFITVNAGARDNASLAGGVRNGTNPFVVGDYISNGLQPWDGLIDEVSLRKGLLTAGDRTQLYNSGNGLAYPFGNRRRRILLAGSAA